MTPEQTERLIAVLERIATAAEAGRFMGSGGQPSLGPLGGNPAWSAQPLPPNWDTGYSPSRRVT